MIHDTEGCGSTLPLKMTKRMKVSTLAGQFLCKTCSRVHLTFLVMVGKVKSLLWHMQEDLEFFRQWKLGGLLENNIYIEDINEDVNPSKPYPIPKDVNTLIRSSVMPQDHLNYTLTWYSLSAAVTFMAFKRLKPQKSRR